MLESKSMLRVFTFLLEIITIKKSILIQTMFEICSTYTILVFYEVNPSKTNNCMLILHIIIDTAFLWAMWLSFRIYLENNAYFVLFFLFRKNLFVCLLQLINFEVLTVNTALAFHSPADRWRHKCCWSIRSQRWSLLCWGYRFWSAFCPYCFHHRVYAGRTR